MHREGLARRIYETTHLTGEFTLRSGAVSTEYFDKYLFESDPVLLRTIAEALVALVPDGVDALAGLELGGVPIATVLSQLTGIPARFVRKEAKTYGTCRLAEGGDLEGVRLCVVEDVVVVIDRRPPDTATDTATDVFAEHGLALHALYTMAELTAAGTA